MSTCSGTKREGSCEEKTRKLKFRLNCVAKEKEGPTAEAGGTNEKRPGMGAEMKEE